MSSLSMFDANAEREARANYQNQYNNEIMNNQNLTEQRKEELKQRVNSLIEPLGQEVLRASGERLIKQYGLKKYYDALKSGDTESLVKSLSSDLGKRAKSIVAGQSDTALKRLGLKDEEISSLKKGLDTGDFSGIAKSKLTDLFSRAKSIARKQDVDKALDKLNVSKQDKEDLPSSFLNDGEKLSSLVESGVSKMADRISNLSGDAKQEFLNKTGGEVPSADELGEHMQELDNIPEANVLTPVDLDRPFKGLGQSPDFSDRETEGEVSNPAFKLDEDASPLWSAGSSFDEEQAAIDEFLANKSKTVGDYTGSGGGQESNFFRQLRDQPKEVQSDLIFSDQPKLLGGAIGEGGGIPFDPTKDYIGSMPQSQGLVSRMVNFFTGKGKEATESPEEEAEPVISQTTARGDLIFDTGSLEKLGIQQAEQFPQDTNINTYRAFLRSADQPREVDRVGGFYTKQERPIDTFNWGQKASLQGASEEASKIRRVADQQIQKSLPKPPRVTKQREEADIGFTQGTYKRGGYEIPSTAPPLGQPSGAEASDPISQVQPSDLVSLQPITATSQAEAPPPSLLQQQGTTTSQLQEDQRLGAGLQGGALGVQAIKKGRQFWKNRKQRNGEDKEQPEEEEPQEPPAEPEPEAETPSTETVEEPQAPVQTQAEPEAPAPETEAPAPETEAPKTDDPAPEEETGELGAEKGTEDVAEKGAEDVAEKGAEDVVEDEVVPEVTGGILDTIGAGLDSSVIGAPLGILLGLGGILAGSGIFNKKPPTPPTASQVSDDPEKFGLQAPAPEVTVSQEVGGGNV